MREGLLLGGLLVLARVLAGAAERDIPVSPEAAEAFNEARRLQQTGDAASAEREFVRALRHTPDFPHAQTALADLRMDAGRAGEAEALYTQVLKRHPAWLAAASSLGFLYLETGRLDEAVGQLSHAAALNPLVTGVNEVEDAHAREFRRLRRTVRGAGGVLLLNVLVIALNIVVIWRGMCRRETRTLSPDPSPHPKPGP